MGMVSSMRSLLPKSVRSKLRPARLVARRARSLITTARSIRGLGDKDKSIVRRSLRENVGGIFRDIHQWRPPVLVEDAEVVVEGFGKFAVRAHSDDLAHVMPSYHRDISDVVQRLVRPGDCTVDAGANMGIVSVFMSRAVGPAGRVVAIEMMPDTAAGLRRNLMLNGIENTTVVELALADRIGDTVSATVIEGEYGRASIAVEKARDGYKTRRISVKTTTLDDLTDALPSIALMKLDLEGAEYNALLGAPATLGKTRAIIMEAAFGETNKAFDILRANDFHIEAIDSRNVLAMKRVP